jgi:hypothetical protein
MPPTLSRSRWQQSTATTNNNKSSTPHNNKTTTTTTTTAKATLFLAFQQIDNKETAINDE